MKNFATTDCPLMGTMEEKQAKIDMNLKPLRFLDGSPDTSVSLKDFVRACLIDYFNLFTTVLAEGETDLTGPGRSRSIIDIYRICTYYYPNTTLREVREILLSFPDLVGHVCANIERRVYSLKYRDKSTWELAHRDRKDELDLDLQDYSTVHI